MTLGQSHSGWSMRRPLSASGTNGPRLSRAVGNGNSPRQPLSSRLRPQEITDKVRDLWMFH